MTRAPDFLNETEFNLPAGRETVWAIIYSVAVFIVPLAVGQNGLPQQTLTGMVVNFFLALAALNLRGWKILWVILLPAFAIIDRGLILRDWAVLPQQLLFLPFVWAANGLMVFLIKYYYVHKKTNRWLVLAAACAAKALCLFLIAAVLVTLRMAPESSHTVMGLFQFYTAVIGVLLAYIFQTVYFKIIIR